jgi:serine/threonine protein kinase
MDSSVRLILDSHVNKGSYGSIYRCKTEEKGSESGLAVKCIRLESGGIPSLLEPSIMATYKHPHLMDSVYTHVDKEYLYIVMESAQMDLAEYLRTTTPPHDRAQNWCRSIATAVECLHREMIIHADIKPGNILLMSDGNVKLTDFTLSTWALSTDDSFTHQCCTLIYRPPEYMIGKSWSFSVDIWALGCTFYEIYTGEILVPYHDIRDKTLRSRKTASSVLHWLKSRAESGTADIKIVETEFQQIMLSPKYHSTPPTFRDLFARMTKFLPNSRLTIGQVLKHTHLSSPGGTRSSYRIVSSSVAPLNEAAISRLSQVLSPFSPPAYISVKTREIYSRCHKMEGWGTRPFILCCYWLANKLICNAQPEHPDINIIEMKELEISICHHLRFLLHKNI